MMIGITTHGVVENSAALWCWRGCQRHLLLKTSSINFEEVAFQKEEKNSQLKLPKEQHGTKASLAALSFIVPHLRCLPLAQGTP